MATATPNQISDGKVQARAKMAGFIDRVIETIQSAPKPKTQESDQTTSSAENPAKE